MRSHFQGEYPILPVVELPPNKQFALPNALAGEYSPCAQPAKG